ncbi:hypothetical protein BR93DRAFT_381676 [Coniochaeta sp. PMI_546]|nr:hypothetical protein BR93DRAFT_381676 [Coniochaeta sp. PMI_546]
MGVVPCSGEGLHSSNYGPFLGPLPPLGDTTLIRRRKRHPDFRGPRVAERFTQAKMARLMVESSACPARIGGIPRFRRSSHISQLASCSPAWRPRPSSKATAAVTAPTLSSAYTSHTTNVWVVQTPTQRRRLSRISPFSKTP